MHIYVWVFFTLLRVYIQISESSIKFSFFISIINSYSMIVATLL